MKSFKYAKMLCLILAILLVGCAGGCVIPDGTQSTPEVEESLEPVTILIAGAWEDCRALETIGRMFNAVYPNCTIEYEYLQDFDTALPKRMTGESCVDLFFTNNIQADSPLLEFALDLYSNPDIDLSKTFDGLIENFEFFGGTSDGEELYAVPLGAELRGMFVNKTLLDSLDIDIPTDQASLLAACAKLKENDYIPIHGNPGKFGQTLLYPWICNLIANADDPVAAYNKVNNRESGLAEMFAEPFEFMYTLVENGYYDYKRAQSEMNLFVSDTDEAYARDFLNIVQNGETYEKADDVGQVAFMPFSMALQGTMEKIKSDYHSEIEYVFMPAPVGEEGGFVYMSPARGIAVNKNSEKIDWCAKFLNFLFTPENNIAFAEDFGILPNTSDAFGYIDTLFDVPANHVSHLGQVTFDYSFYGIITSTLVDISKGNNPKYMMENDDGTKSLYPLSHYTDAFEEEIQANE